MEILKTLFIRIPIVLFVLGIFLAIVDSYTVNQYINIIFIATAIFIFILLHTNWIVKEDPLDDLINKLEKKIFDRTPEELAKIKKIKLFNISNINRKYEVLGMIESEWDDKGKAIQVLKTKAYLLGANAVINVTSNIENDVNGYVTTNRHRNIVSGETSTKVSYHYQGTAIKVLNHDHN